MEHRSLQDVVTNIDARLGRVEQFLPTLATKDDLAAAITPLATKDELAAAIAPLATKAELAAGLADTKAELRADIREEGERTRRHFDVVAERLEGHIRLLAEAQSSTRETCDARHQDVQKELAWLDRRVMRLEGDRRP
jgi:hypothetical protein